MSDHYQLRNSSEKQEIPEPYVSKTWIYTNDTNNGQYGTNQVDFDLSAIYNTQKLISPSEMYLQIPLVAVMTQDSAGGFAVTNNDWALCFKSGYYNLINSFVIEYDGKQITQSTTNTNFYVNFKMNTTMSENDLRVLGPTLGMYPDNPLSFNFITKGEAIDGTGNGISNNRNLPLQQINGAGASAYVGELFNRGAYERCKHINFNPAQYSDLKTLSNFQQEAKNYCGKAGAGANECFYWITTATIRLKDISPFFENMPLVQGFYSKIRFNMNLGSFRMTKVAADFTTSASLSNMNFPYQTNPIMICSQQGSARPGGFNPGATATEVTVGIYIAKPGNSVSGGGVNHSTLTGTIPGHTIQACRIYTPLIELQPDLALKYLNANRNKAVLYEDLNYGFVSVSRSNNIMYTINSINNPIGVLVVPMIASTTNGSTTNATYAARNIVSFAPSLSPFASEPATTSPVGISNFNIQLSGTNVMNSNVTYNFELFNQEFYGVNAMNSGLYTGVNSGLIDQLGFESTYKYYYVNLERRLTDNITPKSITLIGVNNNEVDVDYHIFVITRKQVNIDCSTGRIVSINLNA